MSLHSRWMVLVWFTLATAALFGLSMLLPEGLAQRMLFIGGSLVGLNVPFLFLIAAAQSLTRTPVQNAPTDERPAPSPLYRVGSTRTPRRRAA